jgi:Uma2 family endonuclease
MASHAPKRMTLATFLEWDDGTDGRYQLVDGVLMMMAPAIEAHGELAAALMIEIGSRLKRSCHVIAGAGIMVEGRSDTCYVADLAVTCAPREPGRRMVAEPALIVEVVAPSAGPVDRWRKVADYRTLLSVQEILIAFHDERRVTLQRREPDGWRVEDLIGRAPIRLGVCDTPIPLDALYRDLLPGPDEPRAPSGA